MATLSPEHQAARRTQIEDAALKLFLKQGFHGVGLRELAKTAGVSLGNIYNHYPDKEHLFTALLSRLYLDFARSALGLTALVGKGGAFPHDLVTVGETLGKLVDQHRDYLTLVYVDIAEFDGRHAQPQYDDLAGKFRKLFGPALEGTRVGGDLDPAEAFTAVYLLFTNYFILSRVIGAQPLGKKERPSVATLARLLSEGLRQR
ncbi:MAG: TetR/AcrR family transcriptional regulator [Archangiaceae bacterium]|nr:TetR/AcrR family transcriptional regulator [Archangiaceae bacterium]